MKMKKIVGLDLGTNSIGWAVVNTDSEGNYNTNIKLGSRIIPMTEDILSSFDKGAIISETANRTRLRSVRRLIQRFRLRRERLHRILHVLNFLPEHYDCSIGWSPDKPSTYGKFLKGDVPKLAWKQNEQGQYSFIFIQSFNEMLQDFAQHQSSLVANGKRVPLDWTLYYLRKKALTAPVSKEELAWLLLHFNQKRGYYQLRGEEEVEERTKHVEYIEQKVVRVEATDERKGNEVWYKLHLANGMIYKRSSKTPLDNWLGLTKAFIVTTQYEEDGFTPKKDKKGDIKRSFSLPKEDDWLLIKKRTESLLSASGKTVGAFIYDSLLQEPDTKVRGQLIRTIERKYYKEELEAILTEQCKYHSELTDAEMLNACATELYKNNHSHQEGLLKRDIKHLIINDILFYQRPLKTKKHLISNCSYEYYNYVDKETGEVKKQHIKCIAKSNPYYQEFRLWQFILNLKLYDRQTYEDVTSDYLSTEEHYVELFHYLNGQKEITNAKLCKDFLRLKLERQPDGEKNYKIRWNYIEDKEKKYPCNETRYELFSALKRAGISTDLLNDKELEYRLWHLLYSVSSKEESEKALSKLNLGEQFVFEFLKVKPFSKDYGAYSEKAIKKLLPLMRKGSMWNKDAIDVETKERINNIINGEIEQELQKRMGLDTHEFTTISQFTGLPTWLACYVVYGRHSETSIEQCWETPEDLMRYIKSFKQYSLRNPIVEKCVLETLRTVHDIWKQEGHIDEIHIELGRSMKNNAEQRKHISNQVLKNESTNLRIKRLLLEFKDDSDIENVRPHSPAQQELLRIYEEGALIQLRKDNKSDEDILKISTSANPTKAELIRYKLWLEQKYRSPYTGKCISLSKLFTKAYEIEHVIPISRYYDNSFSNKVICEAEVNELKSNSLAFEFIQRYGGAEVLTSVVGKVTILKEHEYTAFVNKHYANNRVKREKLLMTEIPQTFISRQLNDSRYISKIIKTLLSNIVREKGEKEDMSKNVIVCTGAITDKLKQDWGLDDVWNDIVAPRFKRLNNLTGTKDYGDLRYKDGHQFFQTTLPSEYQKGFSKKRIDHRHHAMDVLVIACASRSVVNFLNSVWASGDKVREDLRYKLCSKKNIINKPWESFTQDAKTALQDVVVSFKNNIRVINKTINFYEKYDANGKKVRVKQQGDNLWAIRKALHEATIYGHVNLRRKSVITLNKALTDIPAICNKALRKYLLDLQKQGLNSVKELDKHFNDMNYVWNNINVSTVEVWQLSDNVDPMGATRKLLDASFDDKKIKSITDTGIQSILLNYLKVHNNDPKEAFTPEGIADMNNNISSYNNGKVHKPIIRVRVTDKLNGRRPIGSIGCKKGQFVKGQKGTNIYFAIYEDVVGIRIFETIPLRTVIERLKQGLNPVPDQDEKGNVLKFYLSPTDLVYVPTEREELIDAQSLDKECIYKMVKAKNNRCFFIPFRVAKSIVDKMEYNSGNSIENTFLGKAEVSIKKVCWKLEVDRLGNITNVIK